MEIVFLEMGKLDDTKPLSELSSAERWLYFLKYVDIESKRPQIQLILQESVGITMAMDVLKEISADEHMRTRIRLQQKAENDQKVRVYYATRQARKQGLAEGIAEGLTKGEQKKAWDVARKALPLLDDSAIAQLTGLPQAEVAALRSQASR